MSERKENIIKISVSAVLLIAATVITKAVFPSLPYLAKLLIYLPSYLIVGHEVLFEAAEKLFKGRLLAEDFLMSIATIGAIIMGDFPEATFVMMFFLVGETFEQTAEERSEKTIKSLLSICSDTATVIRNGKEISVDAKEVKIGETVIVKVGERIPIDGVITEGKTKIDTSSVTGEATPKTAKTNENVYSGTVNLSSVIKIKTTKTLETSTAAKILDLVKNSAEKKTKTEKFITRFAKVYTPIVVVLAVLFAVVPSVISGNAREHIYSALTFLVVSCPCALVVSVPISFFGAIGRASREGILVKGSAGLENFSKVKVIAFDKTGTLTKGNFEVTAVHPQEIGEKELVKIAASCEKYSTHPIALSVIAHLGNEEMYDIIESSEISGRGIKCFINGSEVLVGNDLLMTENGIEFKKCHHKGTIIHIAVNKKYAGHIVISDSVKTEAEETVKELKCHGIKTVMLTGDAEETAGDVAKKVGVDKYYAALLPDQKVKITENLIEKENLITAFCGDGINDAPVLARANVGIAMGALGSDAAVETADIVIMDDNISKLSNLMKISKKAVRIAKENIVFSIGIKVAVLVLSAMSVPDIMWFAAFADAGVLALAVLNSMRTMKD